VINSTISPETDPCTIETMWLIVPELAQRIVRMASILPFKLILFSGYRTEEHQDELRRKGRPAAPRGVSTHTSCPATGADLKPAITATNVVKATFGAAVHASGLRWGGGSPINPDTGIPSDWKHVDLGPRR